MIMLRSSHSRSPRTNNDEDDSGSVPRDCQISMATTTTNTTVSSKHTYIFPSIQQQQTKCFENHRRNNHFNNHNRKSKTNRFIYTVFYLLIGSSCGVWYGIQSVLQDCNHSHRDYTIPKMMMTTTTTPSWYGPKSTMDQTTTTATTMREFNNNHKEPNDGWQTIHVYHGPQARDGNHIETKWYSQAHQDEIIIGLFRNRTQGYYIDLAANDAIELSNTYALEKYYHWNGLCIEPNPIYWYNLSYYRRHCHIVAAVVGNISFPQEEIYFRFNAGDHGGIANNGFNNGKRWQYESQRKYTIPLVDILQRFRVPSVIDYLSLDVEGAETYILHNFPFTNISSGSSSSSSTSISSSHHPPTITTQQGTKQYHIQIMTAERLRGTIRRYIKEHQYHFVQKLAKWGESLWVHENYYINDNNNNNYKDDTNRNSSILDWSILNKYNFPV